jgi:tetratricopeptide (TPR) repeat protein
MDKLPVRLAVAGGLVALVLSSVLVPKFRAASPPNSDILVQVLGGTADLAADQAYREADVYFHGGRKAEGRHTESDDLSEARLPLLGYVKRLQGEAAPRDHRHLGGTEEKEVLPWFEVTVRLNPHHVEAYSTGSYWYFRTGDRKRALEFVSAGIRQNPDDYRLYFDRGIIYYRLKSWDGAIRDLQTARRLWKNLNEDSPLDLKAIGRYLGYAASHRSVGS